MKDWLSKFMRKNRNASKDALDKSRDLFVQTCDKIITYLGEKPFHIRAGLNAAVFDAVMTAFSNHLDKIPSDIAERYDRLIKDNEFDRTTKTATTDVDTVKERLNKAESVLFG